MRLGTFQTLLLLILACSVPATAAEYRIQKVAEGIHAALVPTEEKAASNAVIIVTDQEVLVAGAHFTKDGIKELVAEAGKISPLPLRRLILTHHHRGYNYHDFDLPPTIEVIGAWQTWQAIKNDYREMKNPFLFFEQGITLQSGKKSIVLRNMDSGHSSGDVILFLPESRILFSSDLVFNDVVGYMGDGHMREWAENLQALEELDARVVIPGVGNVTDTAGVRRFRMFMQDFFTEVLRHLEMGKSLVETKKSFHLPVHQEMKGFGALFDVNVERAFHDLRGN